ncbi:MAG TPA: hypothetical protein VMY41_06530, partial [Thermohalobaculum sp.]|nr:hypothetical protein [Thermohalobaculum sp.]
MIGLLGLLFSGAGMLTVLLGFGVAIALAIYLRLDRTVFVILLMAAGGYMLSERVFQAGVADCERRVELAVAKIERERAAAIAQVEEESKAEIQKLL